MQRRGFLASLTRGAAVAGLVGMANSAAAQDEQPAPPAADGRLEITKVRAFLTMPARSRLVVVRVETSAR